MEELILSLAIYEDECSFLEDILDDRNNLESIDIVLKVAFV